MSEQRMGMKNELLAIVNKAGSVNMIYLAAKYSEKTGLTQKTIMTYLQELVAARAIRNEYGILKAKEMK